MSPAGPVSNSQTSSSSKKNKNKKKKASSKTASNGDSEKAPQVEKEVEGEAEEDGEPEGNEVASPNVSTPQDAQANELLSDDRPNGHTAHTANGDIPPSGESPPEPTTQSMDDTETEPVSVPSTPNFPESADTSGRLEALSQDREALRAEVEQLRKSLEEIQSKHEEEVSSMRAELEESESARDQAQSQYQSLLGKINSIKNTLGERMAASRQELEQAKDQIDELEAQNESLKASTQSLEEDVTKLREEKEETSKKLSSVRKENEETSRELSSLRNRHNLSQQNWLSEREDLLQQNKILREEAQAAKEAMGDWEVLAMEERSIREGLADRVSELEEQLLAQKEAYERAASDRDSQSQAVEGLQRALREIQEARKVELREMVESTQGQVESLNKLVQQGEARATEAEAAREALTKEVERLMPFESQIKEKNLLIGKLRHEAIVLNDHLAKALRFLKKAKPEDNIDRQIVTNHFLQFLALDRSDPKKFQILQIIAALLNWDDEQKEQAGLARKGASSGSLRLPQSPFHRTPSTPSLGSEYFPDTGSAGGSARETRESLAELWSGFLERQAEEGSKAGSRSASISSNATGSGARPDTRG